MKESFVNKYRLLQLKTYFSNISKNFKTLQKKILVCGY